MIEIKMDTKFDIQQIQNLYNEAGWLSDQEMLDITLVEEIIRRSWIFAAAYEGQTVLGMARAISDGISDAYIQDVYVAASRRGAGIGQLLIRTVVDTLISRGVQWIGLIGKPGTQKFYHQLGFKELLQHCPMIYDPT